MTGLERLRGVMAGRVGEAPVLRAMVDIAASAACLSGEEARCGVMEAMADGGSMIATAHQAIRDGHEVALKPAPLYGCRPAGRA